MREVVSLHVGGAGVGVGSSCWSMYCLEHGIELDGSLPVAPNDSHAFDTFFVERDGGDRWTPRAVFIDSGADAIDVLRAGELRQLVDPQLFVNRKEKSSGSSCSSSSSAVAASSSSFAEAHGSQNRALMDESLDRIRLLAEACTGLQGFLLFHSAGGGAGSGLSSLLLESLADEFSAKTRMNFPIYSRQEPEQLISAADAYNSVLATHTMIEHADVTVPFDNNALHRICNQTLDMQSPTSRNYNGLLAPVLSMLTASLRYTGCFLNDLEDFVRNLVPYPRVHMLLCSYERFWSCERIQYWAPTISEFTEAAFEAPSMLVDCDPHAGKYTNVCLMYRGDVVPKDVNQAVRALKNKRTPEFVDWAPVGFRCGINFQPLPCMPWPKGDLCKMQRALCTLSNTTAIQQLFSRVTSAFDSHWSRKTDWQAYSAAGLESSTLEEARENLATLQIDYEEMAAGVGDTEEDG